MIFFLSPVRVILRASRRFIPFIPFSFPSLTTFALNSTNLFSINLPPTQPTFRMDTVKAAVNDVSETVQGTGAEASKEANKTVAKDSDASIGTRFDAVTSAVGDKVDQHGHEADAKLQKEKVKH